MLKESTLSREQFWTDQLNILSKTTSIKWDGIVYSVDSIQIIDGVITCKCLPDHRDFKSALDSNVMRNSLRPQLSIRPVDGNYFCFDNDDRKGEEHI